MLVQVSEWVRGVYKKLSDASMALAINITLDINITKDEPSCSLRRSLIIKLKRREGAKKSMTIIMDDERYIRELMEACQRCLESPAIGMLHLVTVRSDDPPPEAVELVEPSVGQFLDDTPAHIRY